MAENGGLTAKAVSTTHSTKKREPNGSISNNTKQPNAQRPSYKKIHALPLPLVIHPLPPLLPNNPLSLFHIAYVFLRQTIWRPSSVLSPKYLGHFSLETQSVHITDRVSILGLWNHGFFGKGNLSRSEPTWLEREKKRRGLLAVATSEETTQQRRMERQAMKLDRARKEQEAIEKTLKLENGTTKPKDLESNSMNDLVVKPLPVSDSIADTALEKDGAAFHVTESSIVESQSSEVVDILLEQDIKDEEHLQLTLQEAFFLSRMLGVLDIKRDPTGNNIPTRDLFSLFMRSSTIPKDVLATEPMAPDNPFIISYVAYHHFRSLGWVVRPGNKFSVDYLLYLRGPVFTHAEFAVLVLPSYNDQYWVGKGKETQNAWHWVFMVNRVQSSVRKTLMICYVDVPPPIDEASFLKDDIGVLLQQYKVREFMLKRWSQNRNKR